MDLIAQAVRILAAGGLVAFPTETVYGLGADATNADAIRRIFAAKGRPATNPLIAHVADADMARRYALHWPRHAQVLGDLFWPGPLTLVLAKSAEIAAQTTAGGATVGLRCPNHPLALELLRAFGGAVAAPSANRSTHISPTTAEHVREELGDAVDLVLDGGPCQLGIESTVLDLSRPTPTLLRPGSITREQIERAIGPVEVFHDAIDPTHPAASPGQQAVHYAPQAPAYRFCRDEVDAVIRWCEAHPRATRSILTVGAMPPGLLGMTFDTLLEAPADPQAYARDLYATLRKLDLPGTEAIFVEMPPDEPAWTAVRDRIRRATVPIQGFRS